MGEKDCVKKKQKNNTDCTGKDNTEGDASKGKGNDNTEGDASKGKGKDNNDGGREQEQCQGHRAPHRGE